MAFNLVSGAGKRSVNPSPCVNLNRSVNLFWLLLAFGCASAKAPLQQERSTVVAGDAGDPAEEDETTPSPATSRPSTDAAGHWVLVQRKDSHRGIAESWEYDEDGRLVNAREVYMRRDTDPYYAVDIALTYDGDHVTAVHDAVPEDVVDTTFEYELRSGRVVEYSEAYLGEVHDSRSFDYDAAGRLVGGLALYHGNDEAWTLERRSGGDPIRLLNHGELVCDYEWRIQWLGTTCYTDGVATQTYLPDASGRLGQMTLADTTVDYEYDAEGHLTQQATGTSVYEYRYAPDAKLQEVLSAETRELHIYDDRGLLETVTWTDGSGTSTRGFTYERVSAEEVVETETSDQGTIVRTYKRMPHAPIAEPTLPSFWTELRMDQPSVYIAPTDYSNVP